MHALLQLLSGGDRRSIGESNRVVSAVREQPELIAVLMQGIESDDPVLRMRCADALEKTTVNQPELLVPYKKTLLQKLSKIEQQEVRWHIAPMLARLPLSKAEELSVLNILLNYTNDRSSIVKTMAMQALADIAFRHPPLLPEVKQHIEELTVIGTPAMKARGRKLLAKLTRAMHG
jgi:HEAT repeat protein